MQYNVSNQVNVLIICLLYTISSKEILFFRVIMWEHLMFLVGCLIISSCLVPASFFIVTWIQKTSVLYGFLYQIARKHAVQSLTGM